MSGPIIIDMGRLEEWPVTHLRSACRKNGVKGYTKMGRDELAEAVRGILKKLNDSKAGNPSK